MIIDYVTGVSSAIYNKELSSKIGFKGILKKMIYLCIVAVAVIVDKTQIDHDKFNQTHNEFYYKIYYYCLVYFC